MDRSRLTFALERIEPHQWRRFEEFATEFLAAEYPTLRSVSSQSGDGGRDAELFQSDRRPEVVLQISVAEDWKAKIKSTVARISETLSGVKVLVYVTSKQIGAGADDLKYEFLQSHQLMLDIHDASWFLDRYRGDNHREAAASALARDIVDPYLKKREVVQTHGQALSSVEYRAALLYLQLQWEDDTREKGLTKLAFDALVRTVLQGTDSENRLGRSELHKRIHDLLGSHSRRRVETLTNSALRRLEKKFLRHWTKQDEFCLTHDEVLRIQDRTVEVESAALKTRHEILQKVRLLFPSLKEHDAAKVADIAIRCIEQYLWGRGELFASAVASANMDRLTDNHLDAMVQRFLTGEALSTTVGLSLTEMIELIEDVLLQPGDATQRRFRALSDAYTLLAFLQETPDVQSAVSKMFAHGTVWIDTNMLLPLFAEKEYPENRRRFSHLIISARKAGIKLRVTEGVLEELERHMNRCVAFVHAHNEWRGDVPFLAGRYLETGRSLASITAWLENFRGSNRPEDDLADYLGEFFSIEVKNLTKEVAAASEDLRIAVQEIWRNMHDQRRSDGDEIVIERLARHDLENYVGVLQRRRSEKNSPLGYSSWWLTLDSKAYRVQDQLKAWGIEIKSSPVMSADFLLNYLAIGPSRRYLPGPNESQLPLSVDWGLVDYLTPDLLSKAEHLRRESADLPEHVVRRHVRDHLDSAKRKRGPLSREGLTRFGEDIDKAID